MTDDDDHVLDIDAFTKLIRAAQDSSNFGSHKNFYVASIFLHNKKKGMHNINAN